MKKILTMLVAAFMSLSALAATPATLMDKIAALTNSNVEVVDGEMMAMAKMMAPQISELGDITSMRSLTIQDYNADQKNAIIAMLTADNAIDGYTLVAQDETEGQYFWLNSDEARENINGILVMSIEQSKISIELLEGAINVSKFLDL